MKIHVDRRITKTQKNIRSAYIDLLGEKSRNQITVKEIAEKADINRKTFYSHYTNIDDIFNKLDDEIIDRLLVILEDFDSFDSKFDTIGLLHQINIVMSENFTLYEKLIFSDVNNSLFDKVSSTLRTYLYNKYTIKYNIPHETLNYSADFIASGITSIYFNWFKSDKTISLDELGQISATLVLSGFSSIIDE